MSQPRSFPYEFESQKEILFYPKKPEIFSGDILEIGPGRGDWILEMASRSPEKKFVALEMGTQRYLKLISQIEKNKRANILLIKGDARIVIPQFFCENSFEKIVVMFPDPWPKKRHQFRRLLTVEFLALLAHVLKKGGLFTLATDSAEYIDSVRQNLKQVKELVIPEKNPSDSPPFPGYLPTYFEKKWKSEGRKIFYLTTVKN